LSAARLTSPAPGSTLPGPSVTFQWVGNTGVTTFDLWLGTSGVGSNNLWSSGSTTATSATVGGLPTNGETIYARLFAIVSGVLQHYDYTFTATSPAMLTSPTPGGGLPGPNATFMWSPANGATGYDLWLGTSGVGSNNLWSSGMTTATSVTFGQLPASGVQIYARLFTYFTGGSAHADFLYTAASAATLTSPTQGFVFTSASQTFQWSPVSGVAEYSIWVGSSAGSNNLGYTMGGTTSTSYTLSTLPTNGETIYVRLWTTYTAGGEAYVDYTFTAFNAGP
jgi:predicted phage tail protein